jgi:ribose transport system substrate-binding protein
MSRRAFWTLLVLVIVISTVMASCTVLPPQAPPAPVQAQAQPAQQQAPEPQKPGQGKTIALTIPFAWAPFYWAAANGLKDEAERMGYEVVVWNAAESIEKQVSHINQMQVMKVAAGAAIAADADALKPSIDKLMEGGVPFFAIDRDINTDVTALIVTDNVVGGKTLGKYARQKLEGKPVKALVMHGMLSVVPFVDRANGFLSAFADYPNFTVVGTPMAEAKPDKAMAATKAYLQSNPDINVIMSVTDVMDAGIISALEEMGKMYPLDDPKHIIIVSVDGNGETLKQVRDGKVDATFSQYPYLQGVWTARLMNEYISGRGDIIPKGLFFGGDLLTRDNIDKYKNLWGDKEFRQDIVK